MDLLFGKNLRSCAPWEEGEEPKCTYSVAGYGFYWCPLESKEPGCGAVAGVDHCLENSVCFEEKGYGVCGCRQCPCPEGTRGKDCELCDHPGCGGNCTNRDMMRPGGRFLCRFTKPFYNQWYKVIYPRGGAEPLVEFNWDNDTQEANFTLMFSMCTRKEKVTIQTTYKDCSVGMKAQCEASGIPNPCIFCATFLNYYSPSDDAPDAATMNAVIESVLSNKGIYWGCDDSDQCNSFIEGLFGFGVMACTSGLPCELVEVFDEVDFDSANLDDETDESTAWTAVVVIGVLVAVVILFMVLAYLYRFKGAREAFTMMGPLLSWMNISWGGRSFCVLEELEGHAQPGSFIAIMGPIGAGKSTLLKVLGGRLAASKGGSVCADGRPCSVSERQRLVGFVPQESSCHPLDTVEEAISFACAMGGGTFPQIGALEDKLSSTCGSLSGGQRRLVDIYVELARRPRVLLLDEPTTGLDNDAALALGQLLKEVSSSIAVVATVHQPRAELAELFTEVMILNNGILACHGGDTSAGVSAVDGTRKLIAGTANGVEPPRSTTLDKAMDLVAGGAMLGSSHQRAAPEASPGAGDPSLRATPWLLKQLLFLAARIAKRACRRGKWSFVATAVFALVLGLMYHDPPADVNGARQRLAIPFLVLAYGVFQATGVTYEPTEALELAEHEVLSRVYSRVVESVVRLVGLATEQTMHAGILVAIMYPIVGLRSTGARPVVFVLCIVACYIGSALVARTFRARTNTTGGMVRALTANGFLLLHSGLFVKVDEDNVVSTLLQKLSFMGSAYQILAMHELSGQKLKITFMNEVSAMVLGDSVLDYFALPTKVNELPERLATLGWQILGWAIAAFVVLCIPPRFYTIPWWAKSWSTAPRVTVQAAAGLLSASLESTTATGNAVVGPEKMEEGRGMESELVWSALSNPDVFELSGGVRTGQLLGILGPCGSGKTTLLAMLTGRIKASAGEVRMNGKPVGPFMRRGLVGYVPQQDALCPMDRVQEAVAFAATASGAAKPELGGSKERLISELSPGQRRIASVAVELARRPRVLALDEPTSGLDATSSVELMAMLKSASKSLPVIATLHQPRPELAQMLTHVLIMAGGQVCACLPFADFERAMLPAPKAQLQERDAVEEAFSRLQELKEKKLVSAFEPTEELPPLPRSGRAGIVTLFIAIMNREFCRTFERDWYRPLSFLICWGLIAAVLLGITYMHAAFTSDLTGIRSILGVISAMNTVIAASTITRISEFHTSRRHYMHELESKVMSPLLHALCQTLMSWAVRLPSIAAFSICLSLFLSLRTDTSSRLVYLGITCLTTATMILLADAVSAFSSAQATAVNLYAGLTLVLLMAGTPLVMTDFDPGAGSAVQFEDPAAAPWVVRISLFTSASNAHMNNELVGRNFTNDVEVPPIDVPGEKWLAILGISQGVGREIGILTVWCVCLWLAAVLGLFLSVWPRRRAAIASRSNPVAWLMRSHRSS